MHERRYKGERVLRRVGWLVAELVVVFIGVFAAFNLSQYQEEQQQELRRAQIYETLQENLEGGVESARQFLVQFDSSYHDSFFTPLQAGEMPELTPVYFTLGTMYTGVWEAMLESGGLDALEIELLEELDALFDRARRLERVNELANMYSSEILAPNLRAGRSEFYDSGTGTLHTKYSWYPYVLRTLRSDLEQWVSAAEGVLMRTRQIE
jgi:hypothetical protein